MKSNFEHIVTFYGAIFHESECWICMELMDTSLDKFYKIVYNERGLMIPESVLAKITVAVSLFFLTSCFLLYLIACIWLVAPASTFSL